MEGTRERIPPLRFPLVVPAHPAAEAPPAADVVGPGQLRRFISVPGYADGVHENVSLDGVWGWYPIGLAGQAPISETIANGATHSVNDVFSAAHEHYIIVLSNMASSANCATLSLKMRGGGSDASGTNYYWGGWGVTSAAATGARAGAGLTTGWGLWSVGATIPANGFFTITLFRPAVAGVTGVTAHGQVNPPGIVVEETIGGEHNLATAYDGFTLIPAGGTLTGTVRVYPLRDAA